MDKFKKFVKKESFYVILFVCLCIVAGVATFTAKRNSKKVVPPITDNSASISSAEKSPTIEYDDAELVKDEKQDQEKQKTDKKEGATENKGKAVATSASNKKDFVTPIKDGKVTRTYNIAPRLDEQGKTAGVYKGIDIESSVGTDVMAVADGKVTEAKQGDSKEGFYVKIEHTNGMIAFYGNLDPQIKVKEGDKVTQGTVIGKVGNTIKTSPKDRKSAEYLLFHMEKSKEPVDPQKYVKELKVK